MKQIYSLFGLRPALLIAGLLLIVIPCFGQTPDVNGILYVKKGSSGSGNSWSSALGELANALKAAKTLNLAAPGAVNEIWVAKGTYKPMYSPRDGANFAGEGRDNAFLLVKDVKVYGGFDPDNGIDDLNDIRILPNIGAGLGGSILSGDLDNNNSISDGDTYHVVISSGDIGNALLDGFRMSGGNANYNTIDFEVLVNSEEVIRFWGGGMYILASSPTVVNCSFKGNYSNDNGGGMMIDQSGSIIKNCNFIGNEAEQGSGISSRYSIPGIINCCFSSNTATQKGGGIHISDVFFAPVPIINCSFSGNKAISGGAISGTFMKLAIKNSIAWDNEGGEIYITDNSPTTVTNSIVKGGFTGTGNKDIDPLFADAANDNLRLLSCSPAIDAGNSADVPADIPTDLDGNPRIINNTVDMGSYEYATLNALVEYYVDGDMDGYGSLATALLCSSTPPVGYSTNNTDCNDNDAAINPETIWILDLDQDGFYGGSPVIGCTKPTSAYIIKTYQHAGDCNDNSARLNPRTIWIKDLDGDGFYEGPEIVSCLSGNYLYTTIKTDELPGDCNDNDKNISPLTVWFKDEDGDGYGTGFITRQCLQPEGYKLESDLIATSGDCNDKNRAINPATLWVLEADQDVYYTGNPVTSCTSPGAGYIIKTNQRPGDCNDNDVTISPETQWVVDADGDGYYPSRVTSCTSPGAGYIVIRYFEVTGYVSWGDATTGYVEVNTNLYGGDCNDNDAAINPTTTATSVWIKDSDGDGYYTGSPVTTCTSPGTGYVKKTNQLPGDCNDNDPDINPQTIWVLDADGDGYYTGSPVSSCTSPDAGYVIINTQQGGDCNDNAANINPQTLWILDADGDGYYPGSPVTFCTSPGTGYVVKINQQAGDCNDNNVTININPTWYKDSDDDGFSDGIVKRQCFKPANYKLESELISFDDDCNDNNAAINANATEVWDGVDNNCDGQIDEGIVLYTFYRDNDGDTYGDATNPITNNVNTAPPGYVSDNTDCNDGDKTINPATIWYKDTDGDGYSDAFYVSLLSCPSPGGSEFKLTIKGGGDCNDGDASINPETVWYLDADNDGYYTGSGITTCQVFLSGYKKSGLLGGGDCNDNNAAINPATIWYKDADNDGYSDALYISLPSCTSPGGSEFKLTIKGGGDCNDGDASINPETVWYLDADNDGYYTGSGITTCQVFLSGYKKSGLLGGGDCNDNNAAINPATIWYKDSDGDGYSDALYISLPSCTSPGGSEFKLTIKGGGDCNDGDASINPETVWYLDTDNDGYYTGSGITTCQVFLSGYKKSGLLGGGDCNDNNAAINPATIWYKDADNDGYSDALYISLPSCTSPGGSEFKLTIKGGGDCNDGDASINPETVWYLDADNDGYYTGSGIKTCQVFLSGYKKSGLLGGGDCNDNNGTINPATIWILDADVDGYYPGNPVIRCTSPGTGYMIKSSQLPGDCLDNNASVNPTAVEVCGNRIDDNCNGTVDEKTCYVCQNATGLSTTNITSNSATFNWVSIPNPNYWQVQYKSTKPGTKWVDVKPDPTGNKRSVQITGLSSNQSYLWHVKARCGNSWTDYSVSIEFKTASSVVLTRSAPTTGEPENNISADNITVYPNPTSGTVNLSLQLKSMVTTSSVISLTDISGRTIYKQKTDIVKGILNTKIQMPGNAAAGVYVMQVLVDGQSYQYRLVYVK